MFNGAMDWVLGKLRLSDDIDRYEEWDDEEDVYGSEEEYGYEEDEYVEDVEEDRQASGEGFFRGRRPKVTRAKVEKTSTTERRNRKWKRDYEEEVVEADVYTEERYDRRKKKEAARKDRRFEVRNGGAAGGRVMVKLVQEFADCQTVIDEYKSGAFCVFRFEFATRETQGLMNFICGGIYALDGKVERVGENTYMVRS